MTKHQFTLPAPDGLPMYISAWADAQRPPAPLVLFLPGLKGFVNWGPWTLACEQLCAAGYTVLALDYSMSGVPDFGSEFTRLDLAEQNSPTRQMAEASLILQAARERTLPLPGLNAAIDPAQIFLWGHSLGGGTAVLAAAQQPDLKGLVTWASIAHLGFWGDEILNEFRRTGRLNMPNARTGQDYWLGRAFLNDIETLGHDCVLKAAAHVTAPWFIVHGALDTSVPPHAAEELRGASGNRAEVLILENTNHVFNTVHPFKGPSLELERAIAVTITWLNRHLT